MRPEQLLECDRRHIWHPYSAADSTLPLFAVERADGCILQLSNGQCVIDGMSSWWAAIHGYNHPTLNQALQEQSERMAHVMFGGLTHEPAVSLAQTLVHLSPPGLNRVFFCDSGSVSVEVAMKMAMQYWLGRGENRSRFLALKRGYHGDTFGAMSVCDPVTGMHHMFRDALLPNVFAPAPEPAFGQPWDDRHFHEFEQLARKHRHDIAAVVLEPIVQGAGGMRFYSAEYLKRVRSLCDQLDILLIADEIATGFGRTGRLFACEHADISPDILCLGKALTGGYMTLAATLCCDAVAEQVCASESGVFMHGPTFMANPLACAVAKASIDLLIESPWQASITRIETGLAEGLSKLKCLEAVQDVRVLGAIGVVEMREPVDMRTLPQQFVDHGAWLRPFGKLVYLMPPFVISDAELNALCKAIESVLYESYNTLHKHNE